METPKLEWESADAKKEREIREANRAMDARAEACFERSWEEDPSVHHDHDSSERPFRLRGNSVSQSTEPEPQPAPEQKSAPAQPRRNPQRRPNGQNQRRRHAGQQQRPRRNPAAQPRLKESVRSAAGSRSENRKRLDAIRRIRVYLLAAAVVLVILGLIFAAAFKKESAAPQEYTGEQRRCNRNDAERRLSVT